MDDSDLYGAILYIVLYGTFLLFSGKVFYGYIYGVAVFGTVYLDLAARSGAPQDAFSTTSAVLAVVSVAASVLVLLAGRAGSDTAAGRS